MPLMNVVVELIVEPTLKVCETELKTVGKARQNEQGMILNGSILMWALFGMDDVNTFSQKQLQYFAITC